MHAVVRVHRALACFRMHVVARACELRHGLSAKMKRLGPSPCQSGRPCLAQVDRTGLQRVRAAGEFSTPAQSSVRMHGHTVRRARQSAHSAPGAHLSTERSGARRAGT